MEDEERKEDLVSVYPYTRQLFHSQNGYTLVHKLGSDVGYMINNIFLLIADLNSQGKTDVLNEEERKFLLKIQSKCSVVDSYLQERDIKKIDYSSEQFIEFRNALVSIGLVRYRLYEIFLKVVSKTNLKDQTTAHNYIMMANKGEDKGTSDERSQRNMFMGREIM